jgi:hypothetical protein
MMEEARRRRTTIDNKRIFWVIVFQDQEYDQARRVSELKGVSKTLYIHTVRVHTQQLYD